MSTYQPPGEPPSYAQPQDPWAGTQGVASAPTDPIPQAAAPHGQFAPGCGRAERVDPGDRSRTAGTTYVPQQRSRVGTYVLVILAVIVFGGGGGYGAYRWIASMTPHNTATSWPTGIRGISTPGSSGPATTPTVAAAALNVGDCILNTTPDNPATPCGRGSDHGAFGLLGEGFIQGHQDRGSGSRSQRVRRAPSTRTVTAPEVCKGTGYEAYFAWDSTDDIAGLLLLPHHQLTRPPAPPAALRAPCLRAPARRRLERTSRSPIGAVCDGQPDRLT